MSQILSGMILVELQKINPDPTFLTQQKQLADAIALAVQKYINTSVTVLVPSPTGPVPAKPTAL